MIAELRGAIGSASAQQLYQKKKGVHPFTRAGGWGITAKIVVVNGSQRCELHNLAYCRWVGWELSSVQSLAVAILVKSYSAQIFRKPPTHPALYRQRVHLRGAIGSASAQQLYQKKKGVHPFTRAGGWGITAKIVSLFTSFLHPFYSLFPLFTPFLLHFCPLEPFSPFNRLTL